jgi:hypothetical protein
LADQNNKLFPDFFSGIFLPLEDLQLAYLSTFFNAAICRTLINLRANKIVTIHILLPAVNFLI